MHFLFIFCFDFPECLHSNNFILFLFHPTSIDVTWRSDRQHHKNSARKNHKTLHKVQTDWKLKDFFQEIYFFSLVSRWSHFIFPDYSLEQLKLLQQVLWYYWLSCWNSLTAAVFFPSALVVDYMFHTALLIKNSFLPFKQHNFLRWEEHFFDWWSLIKLGVEMVCIFWSSM